MKLPLIMQSASEELQQSLAKIRTSIGHNLSIGESAEESLRRFLRAHLPESIGVAKGEIIDSTGQTSRQIDVILYDLARTPVLFKSDEHNYRIIPVEGVIGVVEVKASISASAMYSVIANMRSVKDLEKRATYAVPDGYESSATGFNLYGEALAHFPIIYSLFAFESSSAENMHDAFKSLNDVLPVKSRIDNACLLDTGVILNRDSNEVIHAVPAPGTHSVISATSNKLLFWFLMNSSLWLQAETQPINMRHYLGEGFAF